MIHIKKKIIFPILLVNFLIVFGGIAADVDDLFILTILLWANMLLYTLCNLGRRSMLFAFLIAFFVFLLGREVLEQFFLCDVETFSDEVQFHTETVLFLSLASVGIGAFFFNLREEDKFEPTVEYAGDYVLFKVSSYVFYIVWFFAIASKITVVRYVGSSSYFDFYTDYSEYLSGNPILYLISKMELMLPVAFSVILASMPSKRDFKIPAALYIVYLLISLGTGQRSTSLLGALLLFIYLLFRNKTNPEERWIKRIHIIFGVIALPFLLTFLSWYSTWRTGETSNGMTLLSGLRSFFYDQGVSINVIKRAYMYRNSIPNQTYLLEFLHSGIPARMLGFTVYHGNSIEHALYGGSFAHSLGYAVLGSTYLAGRGLGSSYIAELFQDLGYCGVIFGSLLYSYIIVRINKYDRNQSVFWMSIRFYMVTQILWAVRGSFTGFITNLLAPTTIVCYIVIFGISNMLKRKKNIH